MTANPTFDQAFTEGFAQRRTADSVRLLPKVDTAPRVGFGRLVAMEVRKLTDTISGRVLLAVIAALVLGAGALVAALFENFAAGGWSYATGSVVFGVGLLMPVLGILLSTQEWTQRTALTTFVIEPRRGRVLLAKILVTLMFTTVGVVFAALVSMGAFAIGGAVDDVAVSWAPEWGVLGGILAVTLLSALMAVGLGMLLMNTPAAIVLYMALPTVMPLIGMINEDLAKLTQWIDPNKAWAPLMNGTIDAETAPKMLVASAIWIVVPLTLGIVRQLRREVK